MERGEGKFFVLMILKLGWNGRGMVIVVALRCELR